MKKLIEQIMKFGIVGVIAFVIDYGLMVLLTEVFGVNYLISATVSFIVSVTFNYFARGRAEQGNGPPRDYSGVSFLSRCHLRGLCRLVRPARCAWQCAMGG